MPTTQRPWPRGKKYASVNNFGFGGTNAHAVLERPPQLQDRLQKPPPVSAAGVANPKDASKRIYVLSAYDKSSLEKQMHSLTIYLEQRPEVFQNSLLPNLVYTLGQRRSHLPWKVAIPARATAELIPALAARSVAPVRSVKEPKLGFVFTGQGAQWNAMGRELLSTYPVFENTMKEFDQYLVSMGAEFSIIGKCGFDKLGF